jgi:prolyl-tRNA editing enzyme YbaK/EbsC (Cys-tRNA(Pro) deacylase)
VPPLGHVVTPAVLLDADLQAFDTIWAAAGTPNAVFRLPPADLPHLTGGRFADIARR